MRFKSLTSINSYGHESYVVESQFALPHRSPEDIAALEFN